MLPTPYLDASEYADYGVPGASAADVGKACRLIDAYLGKPQGLLWSAGADGLPAYMTNAVCDRQLRADNADIARHIDHRPRRAVRARPGGGDHRPRYAWGDGILCRYVRR